MGSMNTNRPMRRVTLRIGMPEERGPRVLGTVNTPGGPVTVTDPKVGPTGVRAEVVPNMTPDGRQAGWAVDCKAPGESTVRILFAGDIRAARAEAKALREGRRE